MLYLIVKDSYSPYIRNKGLLEKHVPSLSCRFVGEEDGPGWTFFISLYLLSHSQSVYAPISYSIPGGQFLFVIALELLCKGIQFAINHRMTNNQIET
jgi:hypothetical protein